MPERRESLLFLTIRWLLLAGWSALFLVVLTGSIGDSPLRASSTTRKVLVALLPQGWAFFTRNPREELLRAYQRRDSGWAPAYFSNSSYRSVFGLSRRARAANVELTALATEVPKKRWQPCAESLQKCIDDIPEVVTVKNTGLNEYLCGDLLLESRPPIPWAWSASRQRLEMPGKVARVYAVCER